MGARRTTTMGKGAKSKKKDKQKYEAMAYADDMAMATDKEGNALAFPPGGWNFLYLSDKFRVKQKVELAEALTQGMCECENKYAILAKYDHDGDGDKEWKKVYKAKEKSRCLSRCCCAPNHDFSLTIKDKSDNKVLGLYHPMKCAPCCCVCCNMCQHEMFIYDAQNDAHPVFDEDHSDRPCCSRPEDTTGLQAVIRQPVCGGVYRPTVQAMSVVNGEEKFGEKEGDEGYHGSMDIVGPYLCIGSFCDSTFKAQPPGTFDDENKQGSYGKIVKEGVDDAEDLARECCTDADNFTIKFEKEKCGWDELEWQTKMWNKAKLLSALFLLDYMFFENEGAFECCPEPDIICRIKCCDLYCCGALIPCYCSLHKGDSDGDGGDGGD